MKRIVTRALAVVVVIGIGVVVYQFRDRVSSEPQVLTQPVTQGDVVDSVIATGTLAPIRTVEVGTLVSGMVQKMDVDFNSVVHAGEVIAELDPATYKAALDSAQALVDKSRIDMSAHEATLAADAKQVERLQALVGDGADNQQDLDTARMVVVQDQALVMDDRATVKSAEAAVEQAKVNLDRCVITSPVDGVVIARNVDAGQTVASSAVAPTLYVLATDLSTLDVLGNIDETDVAKVRPGEDVRFTVASYPKAVFHGTVMEVRLSPTVTNDVVIYQAVIKAENTDLRLLPGMTANLIVAAAESDRVLRVPNAALKFRPNGAVFAALHEPPPTASRITDQASAGAAKDPTQSKPAADVAPSRGGANTVVDRMFAPGPPVDVTGQVWVYEHGLLRKIPVHLGVSDGTWTALGSGDLTAGQSVVTGIMIPGVVNLQPARPVIK